MDFVKFITEQWQLILNMPLPFITGAVLFVGIGFAAGKLFFGTVADIAKARLEAARDDLARLESRKADDLREATFLRAEVAALRGDIERAPRITVGEGPPDVKAGRHGDIYFQLDPRSQTGTIAEMAMFLRTPHQSVKSALDQAASENKPLFLVIYDPGHPTRSKLAYCLGSFLEYQTTRKLVDEYFIGALVPNTDESAKALIPSDDPLESARWVVLSDRGEILRTETLYANPDEGLKRTREAIALAQLRPG